MSAKVPANPSTPKGPLVEVVGELIGNFFSQDSKDVRSLASRYLNLSQLRDYIELVMAESKPALVAANVYEAFPEFDLRVSRENGRSSSTINVKTVFKALMDSNRTDDFFKVATISQKALTDNLPDIGEQLILSAKEAGPEGDPFIKVSDMTKADWAKINGVQSCEQVKINNPPLSLSPHTPKNVYNPTLDFLRKEFPGHTFEYEVGCFPASFSIDGKPIPQQFTHPRKYDMVSGEDMERVLLRVLKEDVAAYLKERA